MFNSVKHKRSVEHKFRKRESNPLENTSSVEKSAGKEKIVDWLDVEGAAAERKGRDSAACGGHQGRRRRVSTSHCGGSAGGRS